MKNNFFKEALRKASMLKHCLLLTLTLITFPLWADNVSLEQARSLAIKFFTSSSVTRSGAQPEVCLVWNGEDAATRATGTEPAFYVFNRTDRTGFIIVAGDDAAVPVLGYSLDQPFKAENMPSNLTQWMNGLRMQINDMRSRNVSATVKTQRQWQSYTTAGKPVKELRTALWDQGDPYNKKCIIKDNTQKTYTAYTGCCPTAVAIVMRYHKWPASGTGTLPGYTYEKVIEKDGEKKSITVSGYRLEHSYNWDNMPLEAVPTATTQQKENIAQLMYDCGVMAKAQYGCIDTGAYPQNAIAGMVTYFNYKKDVSYKKRSWFTDEEWIEMLKGEIDGNRPLLYDGYGNAGGHSFVIDGYDDQDFFHLNWGWSGISNGYFLISNLNPYELGTGGGAGGFYYNQGAAFNLQPGSANDGEHTPLLGLGMLSNGINDKGLTTMETSFELNKQFKIKATYIWNVGIRTFNGEIKTSLFNRKGEWKEDISATTTNVSIDPIRGVEYEFNCTIRQGINRGDYVALLYRTGNNEWSVMKANDNGGETAVWKIIVREDPGGDKTIEQATSLTYGKKDKVITLETKAFVAYKLLKDGSEILNGETTLDDYTIRITTDNLAAGTYTLVMDEQDDHKEMKFIIGKQK